MESVRIGHYSKVVLDELIHPLQLDWLFLDKAKLLLEPDLIYVAVQVEDKRFHSKVAFDLISLDLEANSRV